MYHEKQRKQLCLVHTLNAIMQKEEFTEDSLNQICYSLDERKWFNPHKSWLNLGNYDVNVLMTALAMKDLQVLWFDARQDPSKIRLEYIKALVINIPSTTYIPFMNNRHWYAVLQRDEGSFVNLDSKLDDPEIIPDIIGYIREKLAKVDDKVQLLLVSSMDTSELIKSD